MDSMIWIYSLISVFIVSAVSLIGILTLSIKEAYLRKILNFLISFAAGALLGDAFIHLLPEIVEEYGFGLRISLYVLSGILFFFILEMFIHWRHCHVVSKEHKHPVGIMNLVGDGLHNLVDGMIIAGSYIVSVPVGIATTIAVLLHEIPQEIGDFGILIHAGYTKAKALLFNFGSALLAVLGAVITLVIGTSVENIALFLVPFTAGGFIYIAGSDLIPEIHKTCKPHSHSIIEVVSLLLGIAVMVVLVLLE